MICFNIHLLVEMGHQGEPIRITESGHGLGFSSLYSFGGGRGCCDRPAFEAEAAPRQLLLVGMGDRYGEGASRAAQVAEICTVEGRDWHRLPTDEERRQVLEALGGIDHPRAAEIRALFALPQ